MQILTARHADYAAPGKEGSFHVNSLFIGHNIRSAVQAGRADFTSVFMHEIPRLFREDVLWGVASGVNTVLIVFLV